MSRPLAKGWAEIELGDHVYIAGRIGWRGLKAEEYQPIGPILLSVPNLNHGDEVDFGKVYHITRARYDESPEIQLMVGDTLLVKDGAGIGKLGFVENLPGPATVNSSLLVVRPADELLTKKYLFYYLKGPKFQEIALHRITGSATPHLFQKDIKKLQVLAPPRKEQQRIVTKLETLLGKVDASQQRLAKIPVLLKRFRQSVLAAACSGRLTADWREGRKQNGGWPTATLRGVVQTLDQGWSPKCELQPSPSPKFWGVIKTTAVQAMGFLEHENKRLPDALSPREELELKAGDMLITRAGPRARAGVCCLVRSVRPRLMACDKVYRFRINELVAKAEFIELVLNEPKMVEEIDTLKTGISDSGVNLTQEKFLALGFELPPLPEQKEIVRRVEGLFALADQLELRLARAHGQVDKLTPSLLARAFAGKLVPQDPADEPAEKLLERIPLGTCKRQSAGGCKSERIASS